MDNKPGVLATAVLVIAMLLVYGGGALCAQNPAGKGATTAVALGNEGGEDAEFEALDLSPEMRKAIEDLPADQRNAVKKLVTLLKKNQALLFVWFGAMFLALIVPFRWIYLAFKNQKGWGVALLLLYLFTCISPLFTVVLLVYVFKNREESKKYFLFTLLVYMTFYGATGFIAHNVRSLQGEIESTDTGAPETAGAPDTPPAANAKPGVKTAEPKSRLGKIMAAAEKNVAIAEERSAEGSKIVETTAQAGAGKAKAPAPEKAEEPKKTPPPAKKTPPAAKKTTEPAEERGSVGKTGYATAPSNFRVVSILDGATRKTAMINDGVRNQMVVKGDKISVAIAGGTKRAEVVEILADAVILRLDGRAAAMAINAPKD